MKASTKEAAVQQGMLEYFNLVLLEHGIISEEKYRAMKVKILTGYRNGKAAQQLGKSGLQALHG